MTDKIKISINLTQGASVFATIETFKDGNASDHAQLDELVRRIHQAVRDHFPMYLSKSEAGMLLSFVTDALDHFIEADEALTAGHLVILQQQIQKAIWGAR